MANRNLFSSIKRLVSSLLRLTTKATKPAPTSAAPRPRPPRVKPATPAPSPSAASDYQKIIDDLMRQNEELRRRIDELENRPAQLPQEPLTPSPVLSEDDLPYLVTEDTPEPVLNFSEDDLPYQYEEPDTEPAPEREAIDTTYKNLGSEESLNVLIDFLNDSELSGIPEDSAFFGLAPIEQRFMLLDYIQYQHDANPSLFYKGKKALSLENVPIWGDEFERFVNNTMGFADITPDGAGNIDVSFLDDLIESI